MKINSSSPYHLLFLLSFFAEAYASGKSFVVVVKNATGKNISNINCTNEVGETQKSKNILRTSKLLTWTILNTGTGTCQKCQMNYEGKIVTFDIFKEEDENKWLEKEADKSGAVSWNMKEDGLYYQTPNDEAPKIYKTWKELESQAS